MKNQTYLVAFFINTKYYGFMSSAVAMEGRLY